MPETRTLYVPGNGAYSFPVLGALQYLLENGGLRGVNRYVCFSFGSLTCALMTMGVPPKNILQMMARSRFTKLSLAQALVGKCNKVMMQDLLPLLCRGLTFERHFMQTNSSLEIICLDQSMKHRTFSYTCTPHVCVVDAVIASCALPFLFDAVVIDGVSYMDGGLLGGFLAPDMQGLYEINGNDLFVCARSPVELKISGYGSFLKLFEIFQVWKQISTLCFRPTAEQFYAKFTDPLVIDTQDVNSADIFRVSHKAEKLYLAGFVNALLHWPFLSLTHPLCIQNCSDSSPEP